MKKSKPTCIDLFCGAGGFTRGMKDAGFDVRFANDKWKPAVETYRHNNPDVPFSSKDIIELTPNEIEELSGLEPGSVDVIVGGPPCQGFSHAGTRKTDDERNILWREFFKIVNHFKPKIVLMENVKGILTIKSCFGERVIDSIQCKFSEIGYLLQPKIINTADYGVPQTRERVIMIANSLDIENGRLFPKKTHGPGTGKSYKTVGETIMDLADVEDPDNKFSHRKMRHGTTVTERMSLIREGSNLRRDMKLLPKHLRRIPYAFVNYRLARNKPSCTLVPGHSAFPIHPIQPRSLTTREAARLQTFRDKDRFFGNTIDQALLVGNAVPPLLAKRIGLHLKKFL